MSYTTKYILTDLLRVTRYLSIHWILIYVNEVGFFLGGGDFNNSFHYTKVLLNCMHHDYCDEINTCMLKLNCFPLIVQHQIGSVA